MHHTAPPLPPPWPSTLTPMLTPTLTPMHTPTAYPPELSPPTRLFPSPAPQPSLPSASPYQARPTQPPAPPTKPDVTAPAPPKKPPPPLKGDKLKARVALLKEALSTSISQMSNLFARWDADGSGAIDKKEFRKAVGMLGLKDRMPNEVCDALFDEYDADGSGEIECREYIKYTLRDALARSMSRISDLFRKCTRNP